MAPLDEDDPLLLEERDLALLHEQEIAHLQERDLVLPPPVKQVRQTI